MRGRLIRASSKRRWQRWKEFWRWVKTGRKGDCEGLRGTGMDWEDCVDCEVTHAAGHPGEGLATHAPAALLCMLERGD